MTWLTETVDGLEYLAQDGRKLLRGERGIRVQSTSDGGVSEASYFFPIDRPNRNKVVPTLKYHIFEHQAFVKYFTQSGHFVVVRNMNISTIGERLRKTRDVWHVKKYKDSHGNWYVTDIKHAIEEYYESWEENGGTKGMWVQTTEPTDKVSMPDWVDEVTEIPDVVFKLRNDIETGVAT